MLLFGYDELCVKCFGGKKEFTPFLTPWMSLLDSDEGLQCESWYVCKTAAVFDDAFLSTVYSLWSFVIMNISSIQVKGYKG